MPGFSEIPWIAEHIELYRTDPEKARLWDSSPLGGPGILPTLLLGQLEKHVQGRFTHIGQHHGCMLGQKRL